MKSSSFLLTALIGALFLLLGASFIFGMQTLPVDSDSSCKSACGLGLLFSLFFGPQVGAYVVGFIWSAIGLTLFAFAYRMLR